MAKLTAAKRRALKYSQFALAGRRYPINDKGHAMAARARVREFGSSSEQATVFAKTSHFFKGGK